MVNVGLCGALLICLILSDVSGHGGSKPGGSRPGGSRPGGRPGKNIILSNNEIVHF